jgi:hypothetical protein
MAVVSTPYSGKLRLECGKGNPLIMLTEAKPETEASQIISFVNTLQPILAYAVTNAHLIIESELTFEE